MHINLLQAENKMNRNDILEGQVKEKKEKKEKQLLLKRETIWTVTRKHTWVKRKKKNNLMEQRDALELLHSSTL